MTDTQIQRREVLASAPAVAAVLAGCSADVSVDIDANGLLDQSDPDTVGGFGVDFGCSFGTQTETEKES